MKRRPDREQSAGIALIAVLWLVVGLTMLATTVATLSVSHRRMVQHLAWSDQVDALADSAIRVALLRIIAARPGTPNVPFGNTQRLELLDGTADVAISRELGRVDLNAADSGTIFGLFTAKGWPEAQARTMTSRILDWKDANDTPTPIGGAEHADYATAGLRYSPRNGPFESIDELRQVLGGSELREDVLESFTVYTHMHAPTERQTAPSEEQTVSIGEVIRVEACATIRAMHRCRTAIVRVTGKSSRPLQVFVWRTRTQL